MIGRPDIIVTAAPRPAPGERAVEVCEHKGIGHPDTLTDGACEAAAIALVATYRSTFGRDLHFNVDKGLLIAGGSEPRFGGGNIIDPIRLIVCGRASNPDGGSDIDRIVTDAVRNHLERIIGAASRHVRISCEIKAGSADLVQLYAQTDGERRANDTSVGVGYAPLSDLEQTVLAVARVLKSVDFRAAFPGAGHDFKIMGVRRGRAHSLMIALAFIDRHIPGLQDYLRLKQSVHRYVKDQLPHTTELVINALDSDHPDCERDVYLTVTGLSAEMGDDGQTGRGNRVNGLITPSRPTSMEAAAGKNPVSHPGKIYNVLASVIAQDVYANVDGVSEVSVQLVSRIGQPISDPWIVTVELVPKHRLTKRMEARAKDRVIGHLGALDWLVDSLVRGETTVY